ncbi:lactate racemase domain-containing protein [Tautonia rosea]|uniref:lactate racemase domain-containing protein n=1 Tax=Tautonia rosea TaxID=2728037 RepID=UPI001472B7BF|nr:lactate racemase domain-containing protein [Tautonia rosea]
MRVAVAFQDEQVAFDVSDDRLVAAWNGPEGMSRDALRDHFRRDLEEPRGYPPLRQNVVPGDRVALAIDPDVPDVARLVAIVSEVLTEAGVESIEAVSLGPIPPSQRDDWPASIRLETHAPASENTQTMAYLASTQAGRRIYLNRTLTEADVVVPIGGLGFDEVLGYRGPWSTIFPGLSNAETQQSERDAPAGVGHRGPVLEESGEVSWLLGSLFHVGVLPGRSGAAGLFVGEAGEVREAGIQAVDDAWTFRPESRAELVIAGIGAPGRPTSLDDLAKGLATAMTLVHRGGKIAVLSRVAGTPGPALQRLMALDDPSRGGVKALREARKEPDALTALAIAEALAWADLYLLSALDDQLVDDLGMIALGSADEARRLAGGASSCVVLSQADRTRAQAVED